MILYKLIYIIFILNYSAKVSGEIYFYWDEVVIHSQKDISNFYINLEALADMSRHIDMSIKYFKKKGKARPQKTNWTIVLVSGCNTLLKYALTR